MSNLAELIGVSCEPLDDDDNLAVVDTIIEFADGDTMSVFLELHGDQIRFFDDGEVVSHMLDRGVTLEDPGDEAFITRLTEPEGVTLNDNGELEMWADKNDANSALTRFVSAILAVVAWEANTSARFCMVGDKEKVVLVPD